MKTAICTSRDQSKRLISIGMNKDTADMCMRSNGKIYVKGYEPKMRPIQNDLIPTWSLLALMDMLPENVEVGGVSCRLILEKRGEVYYSLITMVILKS